MHKDSPIYSPLGIPSRFKSPGYRFSDPAEFLAERMPELTPTLKGARTASHGIWRSVPP